MTVVRRLALGLAIGLVLAAALFADLIRAASFASPTPRADAALVLGAAVWNDQPSPVFQARIDHGIALVRDGHVRQLVFTGGTRADTVRAESAVARDRALERGVPASAILVEARSRTTAQNLACAAPILRASGIQTVALVSDPLHLWRARWQARDQGLRVRLAPTPLTRYRSASARARFLAREVMFSFVYAVERLGGPTACPDAPS